MERVYLDCTGLPHSIPVRSDLPNSIYIDASDLQRVLDNFLQVLPNAVLEGLKANPLEQRVMQLLADKVEIYSAETTEDLEQWLNTQLPCRLIKLNCDANDNTQTGQLFTAIISKQSA